jgi:hypothetical protein
MGESMKPDTLAKWTPWLVQLALRHVPESGRIGLRLSLPRDLEEHAREFFCGQDAYKAAEEIGQ